MKIKDIPVSERPREKLINMGSSSLSSSELLAIILEGGVVNKNANELAFTLLNSVESLKNFVNISYLELTKIKGIGPARACKLLAAIELGKRIYLTPLDNKIRLDSPKLLYNYLKSFTYLEKQECFYAVYLDSMKRLISSKLLFKGTMMRSSVHPREIFKEAYKVNASYIVCAHNHPSGSLLPSPKDIEFTNYLVRLGIIHGVFIYDHLIITDNDYYSFSLNKLLEGIAK